MKNKEPEYGGEDNPLNYRNLGLMQLTEMVWGDCNRLVADLSMRNINSELAQKRCKDITNRCWMIWDKLQSKDNLPKFKDIIGLFKEDKR